MHTHAQRRREFYNTDFCCSYRTIAGLCLYCWVKSCLVRLCILFPLSLMVTSTTGARTGPHVKHIRPAVRPVWRKENRLDFHIKRSYNLAPRLQFKHCAQVNAYSWLKEARKLTSRFYASKFSIFLVFRLSHPICIIKMSIIHNQYYHCFFRAAHFTLYTNEKREISTLLVLLIQQNRPQRLLWFLCI